MNHDDLSRSELEPFFTAPHQGERVLGTYMWPNRLFGDSFPDGPYDGLKLVLTVSIGSLEILISRNGGFFTHIPQHFTDLTSTHLALTDFAAKQAFEEQFADSVNQLLCELTLSGIVSEPVSPVHINPGQLIDDHLLIISGSGGREIYLERGAGILTALRSGSWFSWPQVSTDTLTVATEMSRTKILAQLSSSLPLLITGAYFLFSRRLLPEAVVDAWIVIEQILDHLWRNYVSTLPSKKRRDRLNDYRTYTSAIRIEILLSVGSIESELHGLIEAARVTRNKLAHRAQLTFDDAAVSLVAMHKGIEWIVGSTVASPSTSRGLSW